MALSLAAVPGIWFIGREKKLNELVVARAWMDDVLECFDGLVPLATHLWLRRLREVCLFIIDS